MHARVAEGAHFEKLVAVNGGRLNIGPLLEDRKGAIDEPAAAMGGVERAFAKALGIGRIGEEEMERLHRPDAAKRRRITPEDLGAADHPERVTRLVLACTSPGGPHAVERSQEVRRRLADPDRRARGRSLVDLFYTPAWRGRPSDSTLFGDPRMSPEASAAHLRVSAAHDAWQVLPTIAAPTLVLHGSDDLMVPTANAPLLAQRIPGALLHLHHGGRHGFFDEFADEIRPLALDFLLG